MNTETNGSTTATPNKPSTVKKKTVAKKTPAKKAPAKVNGASEGTTLATICKQLKMEPRKARRILRGADGVPDAGARWTFTKAADVAKVTKILKNAVAE